MTPAAGQVLDVVVLAHHPLVTALPFVLPAVLLAVCFVGVLLRGRWERAAERDADGATAGQPYPQTGGGLPRPSTPGAPR